MYSNFACVLAFVLPLSCFAFSSSSDLNNLASGPPHPRPALADRNQNGISDSLENQLDDAAARQREDGLNGSGVSKRFAVIVTFKSKQENPVALARAAIGDFPVRRQFPLISGFAADLTEEQIRVLAAHPDVFRIEEDFTLHLQLNSARSDFGADAARASYGMDGAGIGVCIADSGVDSAHEQFDSKAITFFDVINSQTSPYDDNSHGTHVSSIATGDGTGSSDAARFRGVAPAADLYVVKVAAADGSVLASDVIPGIAWCAEQAGVRIISMSLQVGLPSDGLDSVSQAANAAVSDKGKVVVVAAGNFGPRPVTIGSPAAAEKAITVGACAEWSLPATASAVSAGIYIAPFSSRGPIIDLDGDGNPSPYIKPDICAPGHTINAAAAGTVNGYGPRSGTSMAAPFVSGAIALALQANSALTPTQVKQLLEETAQDRGLAGKDIEWGSGIIDVKAFVARALGTSAATAFPAFLRIEDSVSNNASKEFAFKVANPNVPIAVVVTTDGLPKCLSPGPGGCFEVWSPDLDAALFDAVGNLLAISGCVGQPPLSQLQVPDLDCGLTVPGRQETLIAIPPGPGDYRVRIAPATDNVNKGRGGSFALDISNALAPDPAICNGQAPTSGCTVNGIANRVCLGTPADDVIIGTPGADVIVGLSGNDTLTGGGGRDLVCGGSGNDTLLGSKGGDQLLGEDNDDFLKGGRGADILDGGTGFDNCSGGLGSADSAANCEIVSSVP
jgi:serine protease AprX